MRRVRAELASTSFHTDASYAWQPARMSAGTARRAGRRYIRRVRHCNRVARYDPNTRTHGNRARRASRSYCSENSHDPNARHHIRYRSNRHHSSRRHSSRPTYPNSPDSTRSCRRSNSSTPASKDNRAREHTSTFREPRNTRTIPTPNIRESKLRSGLERMVARTRGSAVARTRRSRRHRRWHRSRCRSTLARTTARETPRWRPRRASVGQKRFSSVMLYPRMCGATVRRPTSDRRMPPRDRSPRDGAPFAWGRRLRKLPQIVRDPPPRSRSETSSGPRLSETT